MNRTEDLWGLANLPRAPRHAFLNVNVTKLPQILQIKLVSETSVRSIYEWMNEPPPTCVSSSWEHLMVLKFRTNLLQVQIINSQILVDANRKPQIQFTSHRLITTTESPLKFVPREANTHLTVLSAKCDTVRVSHAYTRYIPADSINY